MARYNLPKPMSMYRDTGLVATSQEFRNRYVQNMAADNQLAQAVLEMGSREQDQEAKQRLIEKYNTQLQQRSESGNYHMLGNAVVKDAQNFSKDYQPIKQEKQAYDQWLQGLTEQRDSFIKTGKGVDPFTYQAKISEANYTYKGLQYGADGSLDESSRAKLPGYVGYVDVESKIIKHMKDVVMSEIDTTGMETPLDENMQILEGFNEDTQSPAYYVKQGNFTKWLDPKLVSSVVTSVLNQPDTKAYNYQTAHLENFTKDRVNTSSNLSIAAEEVDDILSGLDSEINELESKNPKNTEEKAANEATLENKEMLEEYILDSRDKGLDDVTILTNLSAHNKETSYIQSAVTKYAGIKSEKYVRDYTEGSRFTQNMKNKESVENAVSYRAGADNFVVEPLGGGTFIDVANQLSTNTATLNSLEKTNNKGESFIERASKAVTNEQIDKLAIDFYMNAETAKKQAAAIRYNKTVIELLNNKKEAAFKAIGVTPEEYESELEEFFASMKIGQTSGTDLTAAINNLGLLSNPTAGQAFNYLSELSSSENPEASEIKVLILDFISDQKYGEEQSNKKNEAKANMVSEVTRLVSRYDNRISKDSKELEGYFNKDIPTDVIIMPSFGDPGGTTSELVKNLFKEGLFDDFQLIDKTGQPITYREVKEQQKGIFANSGDDAPEIDYNAMGLAHVPRPDGKAVIAIPFVGINSKGEKTKEMYFADADQLKTPAGSKLSNYINSMQFRVRTTYRHGLWADLPVWEPEYFIDTDEFLPDGDTPNPTKGMSTVRFDYAKKKIYILDTTPASSSFGEYIEFDEEEGLIQITKSLEDNNQSL
mgnify:CR=1 FL=1|tara:strand:- start:4023 stop:6491 length:2469 start_codon:yes stop_codon:yes gene_type:complete